MSQDQHGAPTQPDHARCRPPAPGGGVGVDGSSLAASVLARAQQAVSALDRLADSGAVVLDPVPALAHLLAPRGTLVGAQLRVRGGRVEFRGRTCRVDDTDLLSVAGALAGLVDSVRRSGDTFFDLAGAPELWLYPARSGTRVVMCGARELFGVFPAHPARRPGVSSPSVPPGLSPASPAAVTPTEADLVVAAARTATWIDRNLGAVLSIWEPRPPRFAGTVELLGRLELADGSVVEVPLTQAHGSHIAGVRSEDLVEVGDAMDGVAARVSGGAPQGLVPLGLRLRDGLAVVDHPETGIRAVLRRGPNS